MAQASSIEWTQATWNPIAGCAVVSPGCTNCYAMKMAARHEAMSSAMGRVSPYDGLTKKTKAGAVWNGEMRLVESALDLPITWTKPRTIFVNSMSDLFADGVPDAWIDQVFARMAVTYRHTYQVLTKRSARMRAYLTDPATPGRIWDLVDGGKHALINAPRRLRKGMTEYKGRSWPLPNVWLGVSAEDQPRWDERIPDLQAAPAAIRFVSVEPMLGPIDPTRTQAPRYVPEDHELDWKYDALTPGSIYEFEDSLGVWESGDGPDRPGLDWIIVGGESGHGARPIHPDWVREIRDACADASVAFFFKQWGEWAPGEANSLSRKTLAERGAHYFDGRWEHVRISAAEGAEMHCDDEPDVWRIGKRHSGRLLDGVEHNAMPWRPDAEPARGEA